MATEMTQVPSNISYTKTFTLSWDIKGILEHENNFWIKSPTYQEGIRRWYMTFHPKIQSNGGDAAIFLYGESSEQVEKIRTAMVTIVAKNHCLPLKIEQLKRFESKNRCLGTMNFVENIYSGGPGSYTYFPCGDDILRIKCEIDMDLEGVEQQTGSSLSSDLDQTFQSEEFSDVEIEAKDGVVSCSKIILAARSSVFKKMFQQDMKEAKTGEVGVEDFRGEVVENMVKFMYTDKVSDDVLAEMAQELLVVSHRYELHGLTTICERFLGRTVDEKNAFDLLELAKLYSLQNLKTTVVDYLKSVKDSATIQL